MLEVNLADIESLADRQLQSLLDRLTHLEARRHGIATNEIAVPDPIQINVPDGGVDGSVRWHDGPPSTPSLPNRIVGFQSKAKDMRPAECSAAMLVPDGDEVARMVREILDAGGIYIMFCRKGYVEQDMLDRIASMRDGLRSVGYARSEEADLRFYDGNKIRSWTNEYQSAVNWVRGQVGKPTLHRAQTFESWSKNPDVAEFNFVGDERLLAQLDSLIDYLVEPGSIVRLTGLPGVGKTRLAFEALARTHDPTKPSQKAIRESVLYLDATENRDGARRIAEDLRNAAQELLLVVDDCDISLHNSVSAIARHQDARFSLLTLDFEPEEERPGHKSLLLEPAAPEVIEGMIKQVYGDMPANDLQRIVEFAEGFPQMAVVLAEAQLAGTAEFQRLITPDVLGRLVWGREENIDRDAQRIIEVCSLFKFLGVEGNVRSHLEYAAILADVTADRFEEVTNYFIKRKRIQRAHRFIQVTPRPLALSLAMNWWQIAARAKWEKLFDGTLPDVLVRALCDQLSLLGGSYEARTKVEELCGEQAPFGQAEVLNSEQGSRCFRSLVDVNPEATAAALERAFGSWTTDQLREVVSGRRDLVGSLEKLAFRRETFPIAARLLMKFAAAENERWGNNATGQFEQLFHLLASGTEVPAIERLAVVDEGIASDDAEIRRVALSALDHALWTQSFTRTVGAEFQGSGPALNEWRATTWDEIHEYLTAALGRLTDLAINDTSLEERAKSILGPRIRGLVNSGLIEPMERAVEEIAASAPTTWESGITGISMALHYDFNAEEIARRVQQSNENKDQVEETLNQTRARLIELYRLLFPTDVAELVRLLVIDPSHNVFPDGPDFRAQEARHLTELEKLAERLIDDAGLLRELVPEILSSGHPMTFRFGELIGNESIDLGRDLLNQCLEVLRDPGGAPLTPNFARGLLRGVGKSGQEIVVEILDQIAGESGLVKLLVPLTTAVTISERELLRILHAVEGGAIEAEECRQLAWGSVLSDTNPAAVEKFLGSLCDQGTHSCWVALEILGMYILGSPEKRDAMSALIRRIVLEKGMLWTRPEQGSASRMDDHMFEELAIKLIENKTDTEVPAHVASELVEVIRQDSFPYDREHSLSNLVRALLEFHPAIAWPIIGGAVLATEDIQMMALETLVAGLEPREARNLELVPTDVLLDWGDKIGPRAQYFLFKIAPLLKKRDGDPPEWSELVTVLLDAFGNDEVALRGLSANLWTFSHAGPLYIYYQQFLEPLQSLRDHPHSTVREWAAQEFKAMTLEIDKEISRETEEAMTGYL